MQSLYSGYTVNNFWLFLTLPLLSQLQRTMLILQLRQHCKGYNNPIVQALNMISEVYHSNVITGQHPGPCLSVYGIIMYIHLCIICVSTLTIATTSSPSFSIYKKCSSFKFTLPVRYYIITLQLNNIILCGHVVINIIDVSQCWNCYIVLLNLPYFAVRKFSNFKFSDATQTILDWLKSLSDDEEADNTDNDEEQD